MYELIRVVNRVSKEWLVEELTRVIGWVGGRVNKSGLLGWWRNLKCGCGAILVFNCVVMKFMIIYMEVVNKFIMKFS